MILAADIGTGSLKAAIIALDGTMHSQVRIPYSHPIKSENDNFNAIEWENTFFRALAALPTNRISALALSGNGPTIVACDDSGNPLAPANLWLQKRSVHMDGQDSYYLPKAAWLKAYDEKTWKKTRWLLSCPEWLQFRLTGFPSMTIPHESFRPFAWTESQISVYGLAPKLFPEIVMMGERAGRIHPEASARTGLPEGLPVAAVGSDFMAALLGSGTVEPGIVCDRAGTSEGINYCTTQPSGDSRLRDLPHVVEGLWNSSAILISTGAVFEWYREFTHQKNRSYEEILNDVTKVQPGPKTPVFFPGIQDETPLTFGGGRFHKMEPLHGPAEMGNAVLEAIGFAVRQGIELLEEAGMPVLEMRVTGGQARSPIWNQMKANITGKSLLIPKIEDAELAGCAGCAAVLLNRAEHIIEGVQPFVSIKGVVHPYKNVYNIYNKAYHRYREMAQSMMPKIS